MSQCESCRSGAPIGAEPDLSRPLPISCRVVSELALLEDVSASLSRGYALDQTLDLVFHRLESLRGLAHGLLVILNRETGALLVEPSARLALPAEAREVSGKPCGLFAEAIRGRDNIAIRELENVIERAVLLSQDRVIHGFHLPPTLQTGEASGTAPRQTLQQSQLGLTERIMGLRVKAHDIDARRFRQD